MEINPKQLKRTPLYQKHIELGAKLVDFAGWEMPVQYTTLLDEHLAVRSNVGIFDISHMGQLIVSGKESMQFLNYALTNDVSKLSPGEAQYSLMCNKKGGVIDDLYVYCLKKNRYLIIVNASRTETDISHLFQVLEVFGKDKDVHIDLTQNSAAVAIQGKNAVKIIELLLNQPSIDGAPVKSPAELKKNQIAAFLSDKDHVWVSRTGYTGEDGFELFATSLIIIDLWDKIFEIGKQFGIKPAGLGARDTLRLEACYPLYGHELDENSTPLEAGLGFFVAFDKGEFIGRDVLFKQKTEGVNKRCIAFKMLQKSPPPRQGYPICNCAVETNPVGIVTSGTHSPTFNIGIGMGYVRTEVSAVGTELEIDIRGNRYKAEIVKKPFYKKQ
ncbi:MAG: glycine cleavage system aminomethyltransferase GcvT [Verrucomicrobiia bacterium]